MHANGAPVAVRFPAAGTEDFFVSGYAEGAEALGGTPAVLDERVGRGRTIAFSFEPNFRAFTDGTQVLLRNAILGRGHGRHGGGHRAPRRGATRLAAARTRPCELVVASAAARRRRSGCWTGSGCATGPQRSARRVAYAIPYRDADGGDRPQWTGDLAAALRDGNVPVVMYRVP